MGNTSSCECNSDAICRSFRHKCICLTIGPQYCRGGRIGRPANTHYCLCHKNKDWCRARHHKTVIEISQEFKKK